MADLGEDPDARLLASVAEGDDAAFATLYGRYLPLILRWSLRETESRELAADLSAEVFAAALVAASRFRPEQGGVAGWLLGIARNKLRESRRRGRVENATRRRLGVAQVELTDADLERVEELASLDHAILGLVADLPVEQRHAILARVVAERPYEEIASELRCSESVIRQRVSRGLRSLRSEIDKR